MNIGEGDTTGFELLDEDQIDMDKHRDFLVLKLKRTNNRLKQTSTSMLQSWRANCDVQIILYQSNPKELDVYDIARVTSYVVSYTCKGSETNEHEAESIKSLILGSDLIYSEDTQYDLARVIKKILHSFYGKRVIGKPECSTLLSGLPLVSCTEGFDKVSTCSYHKLQGPNSSNVADSNLIKRYKDRDDSLSDLNLHDFYQHEKMKQKEQSKKKSDKVYILQVTGLGSYPVWPVNDTNGEHYARATLIMYKPWSSKKPLDFENPFLKKSIAKEYHDFLRHKNCPNIVRLRNANAMRHYYTSLESGKNSTLEDESDQGQLDNGFISNECDNLLSEVMNCSAIYQNNNLQYKDFDKGLNYDWSQRTHPNLDPDNDGVSWLTRTIAEKGSHESVQIMTYQNSIKLVKNLPMKSKEDNIPYCIQDIDNNDCQADVVYTVMRTLREWIEYPAKKKKNPDCEPFKPLRMTVNGPGGTGKSFVIKVLRSVVESIFPETYVSVVTAPTGAAAYNVGGSTCHSFFKVRVKNTDSTLSEPKRLMLEESLKRMLMILIDERGLLSMDLLGTCERNTRDTAHGGINRQKSWGGVPIVIILGDDHQLPSVVIGKKGKGATHIFQDDKGTLIDLPQNSNERNGRDVFLCLATNVKELKKSCRTDDSASDLRQVLHNLREHDGCSLDQANKLMDLHINNPHLSQERRQFLEENALFVYTTSREVAERNCAKLLQLHSSTNPVAIINTKYEKSDNTNVSRVNKKHFDSDEITKNSTLCKEARVSVTRNFRPIWGLYNGALATIKDIVYDIDCSPNQGDFPLYIIVEMDNYDGPQWKEQLPKTQIPIPICSDICSKGCCKMTYVPLKLAFARTLHKTQGKEAGENKEIKAIVFSPGSSSFESINPGTLYTGVSRASSIGNGDIEKSSIYFCGTDCTTSRFTDVKNKRTSEKIKYNRVAKRENWINHLKKNTTLNKISQEERHDIHHWIDTTKLSLTQLDEIIKFHINSVWNEELLVS
jgi:hypothetical protein